MNRLLALFLILSISVPNFAQPIDRKKLDSLFTSLAAKNLAIGSIAIEQNGKLVYQRSFGKDQTASTTYRIGSITKVFTAVMIYQLIDQKKLSLDDTLSKFFPTLPNAGKITIAEMLGHRSGLANFTGTGTNFDAWKGEPRTHEQLLAFIRDQRPDFEPGAKADYNNSNFLLLGYILEKMYHRSYKEIVKERIVDRLGLTNTYYGDHGGYQGKEAVSYKYSDNQWNAQKAAYVDNFGGAGAMISTPQDICKFIQAIFDGKMISKGSLERMMRIEKDGYGWGLFPFGDGKHKGYGHNGQTEGFAASMQYYPEKRLAIGYCTNGELYLKDVILDKVYKICFGEPCVIPSFVSIRLSDRQLEPFVGTFEGDNGLQVSVSSVSGWLQFKLKGQLFIMEALSDHEFRNVRYGYFVEFSRDGKRLIVYDAPLTYRLNKL